MNGKQTRQTNVAANANRMGISTHRCLPNRFEHLSVNVWKGLPSLPRTFFVLAKGKLSANDWETTDPTTPLIIVVIKLFVLRNIFWSDRLAVAQKAEAFMTEIGCSRQRRTNFTSHSAIHNIIKAFRSLNHLKSLLIVKKAWLEFNYREIFSLKSWTL